MSASGSRGTRWLYLLLIGAGFVLLPFESGATWDGENDLLVAGSWEATARRAEFEGPASAREMARAGVRSLPRSLALLLQLAEILVETEGAPRAFAELEALRGEVSPAIVEYGQARVARATGRTGLATRLVTGARPECPTALDRWFRDRERLQLTGVVPADSVAALIDALSREAAHAPSSFLRSELGARLQFLRVVRAGGSPGDASPLTAADGLVRDSNLRGVRWTEARARFLAARLYAGHGRSNRSESEFRRSFALADSAGATRTAGLARSYLGLGLDAQRRYLEATVVREEAVVIFESLDDSLALAYALMGLGWDYERTGAHAASVDASGRALEYWRAMDNGWGQAQVLNNLGVAHFDAGRWEAATGNFAEGLEIATAAQNRQQRSMILNNVALLEDRRGRPDRAVEIYRELLAMHRESGDRSSELDVLNNLGLACLSLGESGQAREFFQSVIDLARDRDEYRVAATTNLAIVLAGEGELDAATEHLLSAREQATVMGDLDAAANAIAWLGRVAGRRGDYESSLRFLTTADSLLSVTGNRVGRLPTQIRLGKLLLHLERYDAAMSVADEAGSLAAVLELDAFTAAADVLRAEIHARQGRREEARSCARRAIIQWRKIRSNALESLDLAAYEDAFCLALSVLVGTADADSPEDSRLVAAEGMRLAMEYHNRNLSPPARNVGEIATANHVDSLLTAQVQWRARVEELRQTLRSRDRNPEVGDRLDLAEAETAMHASRRELREIDPVSYRSLAPVLPTLDQLREQLDDEFALISYVLGPPSVYGESSDVLRFEMRPGEPVCVTSLTLKGDLRRKITLWREMLSRPAEGEDEQVAERRLARELGEVLLPSWIHGSFRENSVLVAADGALSNLSFGALLVGPSENERRLVEVVPVGRCASLALWYELRTRPVRVVAPRHDLVVCGSDAQQDGGLGTAGSGIERRFRRSARIDLRVVASHSTPGPGAGRPVSDAAWESARILHFDAHGVFDERRPWRSGLYSVAEGTGDPSGITFVQQADIMFLGLSNELVTLSACETARAEDSLMHSPMESFAQGLQQAGARSVLATYWNVDEAVAAWSVERVYEQLSDGLTLAGSLRGTQLELMREPATADPFYWASWVVIGDGAQRIPLETRHAPSAAWAWLGLSTVLLATAAEFWRRSTSTA